MQLSVNGLLLSHCWESAVKISSYEIFTVPWCLHSQNLDTPPYRPICTRNDLQLSVNGLPLSHCLESVIKISFYEIFTVPWYLHSQNLDTPSYDRFAIEMTCSCPSMAYLCHIVEKVLSKSLFSRSSPSLDICSPKILTLHPIIDLHLKWPALLVRFQS